MYNEHTPIEFDPEKGGRNMKKEKFPDFSKLKWVKGSTLFDMEALKRGCHPSNVKVRITTYISEDIYRWLKKEADRTGTPYQILLNQKLRQVYEGEEEGEKAIKTRLKKLEEEVRKLKAA